MRYTEPNTEQDRFIDMAVLFLLVAESQLMQPVSAHKYCHTCESVTLFAMRVLPHASGPIAASPTFFVGSRRHIFKAGSCNSARD